MLVCGGRDYADREHVFRVLDREHGGLPIDLLVHGGASGADALAAEWAAQAGVPAKAYPANWKAEGRAAGPKRNQRMLDEARPELVIAFPGGRGTDDMVKRAERAGVPVMFAAKINGVAI